MIDPYTMRLDEMELSTRAYNCLVRDNGFVTVADLLRMTEDELLRIPNFGPTSLKQVCATLAELGVQMFGPMPRRMLNDRGFIDGDFT
jgi:DNA-directed RNA polymerase subunit alpha